MSGEPNKARREITLIQMLSLNLLLLAFFVLLYHNSRIEDARAAAVAGSIHATFADRDVVRDQPVPSTSMLADALAEAEFQGRIKRLLRAEIPIAEIDIVKRDRLLRARLPLSELFENDSARVKASRAPLLRRIAAALSDHPEGLRYDLEVLVGGRWLTPAMLGRGAPIEVARTTGVATALRAAGAPAGNVAAGIGQGQKGWVLLNFHVRSADEGRMTLPVPVREGGTE